MNSIILSERDSLVEEVVALLEADGKDYSSQIVVFPGKRPAHFLRKVLAGKEKSAFIPPKIFSMDEFIDYVYEKAPGNINKKMETLDAVAMLYRIHTQSTIPLGGDSFLSPDFFFPLGFKLYHDLEELYIEGANPRAVKAIDNLAEENIPRQSLEKLQALSHFYKEFYQQVEKNNCSTRSSRYAAVAKEEGVFKNLGSNKIIMAGFFALSKSEQDIFKKLMNIDEGVLIFQQGPGLRETLDKLRLPFESQPVSNGPELYFYKSSDTHGQVYGLSGVFKKKLAAKEFSAQETVIVVPSADTIFPLYNHTLNLFSDNYNISLGYPLRRTPLFAFLNNLMQLISSMDKNRLFVPDYLSFILHPYTKNIRLNKRADITRMLFHAIENVLGGNTGKKLLHVREIETDPKIAAYINEQLINTEPGLTLDSLQRHLKTIHQNTIGKMNNFENVGDFAEKTSQVLTYIYENSTAPLHPFFYPYLEAFINNLDAISVSLMKDVSFGAVESYFSLFKNYITTCRVPFKGTPVKGLQVLGPLETRGLKFEKVVFLDANEGVLPDSKREDSLLPVKARRALGLSTYAEREKMSAYYFNALVKGAKEVHFFYIENSRKEKSRFVEKLCWEKQKKENKRVFAEYIKSIQYSVRLNKTLPLPIEKTSSIVNFLKTFTFSASSLNTYLKCPLQFYYQYVLGIKNKQNTNNMLEIGSFIHDALYSYFKDRVGRVLSENDLNAKEMERIVLELFERKYGDNLQCDTYLLRRQINRHLGDFIKNYQIPLVKERLIEIVDLECTLKFTENSYCFKAKLDRVEKRDGRVVIIDYKSSSNSNRVKINFNKLDITERDSWPEAIGSLQLPVYLLTYAGVKKEKPENIDCMFLLLGRMVLDEKIEAPLFANRDDIKEKYESLQKVIWGLLREITNPACVFTPTKLKYMCAGCDFNCICG